MSASISEQNQDLAARINSDARQNPQSPYVGKYVGIANGQVAVVGDSLRDVMTTLRQVEPEPSRCCCIEASYDYDRVHEIWVAGV